jgi:hypothetical protein
MLSAALEEVTDFPLPQTVNCYAACMEYWRIEPAIALMFTYN